ncbi:acetolactate synthase catalytic subunit [Bosea sp. (in: a-proteobacteria)]|jgi:acetolactate synthase-1/2/3 large subunit|uniref:acetolactate synthase catalytic subunit n=1 Tax=Bosea sp. (in: a-proteobacteria) TaxID=1871050 RepID=UPI002DDCD4DB|nr:acetolactate synthase catalytic subunit [Bosea sp. (in: a-proteobacteria)]HEV2512077.1 acetolactate synthase catalytic subunit [Bosea sp. (in: a-proteobacteria)]
MTENLLPTVAEVLAAELKAAGVELIFGQGSPSALTLATERGGLRQIGFRTENAGTAMADGFARASGRLGCIATQNGAAAALVAAGLSESFKASVPVLVLVQDVERSHVDRNAFQEFDHATLFASCTKWFRRLDDGARALEMLRKAILTATSGRPGPVALAIPADVLAERVPQLRAPRSVPAAFPALRQQPEPAAIAEAARLLANARTPIIVAGGGVHSSGAQAELAGLQERFALGVATTIMGKGAVNEADPLSLGVVGSAMGPGSPSRAMRSLIRSADVVMFVGNRTNDNGTASWSLFPNSAAFIHIDVAVDEAVRNYPSLPLIGDARTTLRALGVAMAAHCDGESAAALRRPPLAAAIAQARAAVAGEVAAVKLHTSDPMRPEHLMHVLQQRAPADTVFVADASYSSLWVSQYLQAREPGRRFVFPRGLAGIGWGYPLALGTRLALPSSPVVAVVGDGGFSHCWAELECAVRHSIGVKLIVLNNAVLGFQRHAEMLRFGQATEVCAITRIDHAMIARAVGCANATVTSASELTAGLDAMFAAQGPFLLDVHVDPEAYPPIAGFARLQAS